MLKKFVNYRWFVFIELLIVLSSGTIWYFRPELGWMVLGFALIPWIIRIASGVIPFRKTGFEIPVLIFTISALIAAWVSYDQKAGWEKFWLIVAAVLLFYALANQPRENYWLLARIMTVLGVLLSIYFLLGYDWQKNPVKVEAINRLGVAWMNLRPSLGLPIPDLDSLSGTLFILLPFPIALLFRAWQTMPVKWGNFVVNAFSSLLLVICLVFAAMTEAGVTIFIAFFLFGWWKISEWASNRFRFSARSVFLGGVFIAVALCVMFVTLYPDEVIFLSKYFPVFNRLEERLDIFQSSLNIINDFPFTGVGLASFSGAYSKYILVIPFFFIPNSYNFFLEILFEMGFIGFWGFMVILFGVALRLLRQIWQEKPDQELLPFSVAILAGFWIVLIIGLFDVVLFSGVGTIFLFVLPGLGVALLKPPDKSQILNYSILPVLVLFIGVIWSLSQRNESILAMVHANLGSIDMIKQDLQDWPWDEGEVPPVVDDYHAAIQQFEKALKYNPGNRTALHRLGLISLGRQDFQNAKLYLERALQAAPGHRGIQKNLGYDLVWLDEVGKASVILADIPEASYELEIYSWWWGTQDRDDLSNSASKMVAFLTAAEK